MPTIRLGANGIPVSAIGLGCSRIGSTLTTGSRADAALLIHHALDRGITWFDTADIYGQGESELVLGATLRGRRDQVAIVTKAGQRFTPMQRVASLAKRPIRAIMRAAPGLRGAIAAQRAHRLPRDYTASHIGRALEGSLRRLRTERVDLFLLHSPDKTEIESATCFEALERARTDGKIGTWGMSCDDEESAMAALRVPGLAALQIPLALVAESPALVAAASGQGVGLIVRELFATPSLEPAWRGRRVAACLAQPHSAALVGTTQIPHLDEILDQYDALNQPAAP